MNKAILVLFVIIAGYSSGLLLEAMGEGENSKLIQLAYTGTISEDWNPFFLDPEMKKIQNLRNTMDAELFSIPKILDFGLLDGSSQQSSPIKSASVAFNVAVVEKDVDGKNTFQNVVDKCVFHAEESYAPMCVICKLTDMQGQIIGVGIVKESRVYSASESIDIPITPVVPEPKEPGPDPECVECEKPDVFTVKYNGPDGADVTISKKGKDPVQFGTFNDGDLIVVDAINDLGQTKVNPETTYDIVVGDVSSSISIHTSCSQFPPTPHIGQEFFANKDTADEIKLTVVSGTLKGVPSIPNDANVCPADDDDDDGKHDDDDDGKHDDDDDGKHDDDDDGKHDDDDDGKNKRHYYDRDDLRKYFDNSYFNKHFSKAEFKKFFSSSEFSKYSDKMSYAYKDKNGDDDDDDGKHDDDDDGKHDDDDDGKHDDDDDGKHDDDDDGKPNGEGNGNIEHVFKISENPVDVQDVNGVKLIICEPPSKCVPVWADFKQFEHGTRQNEINAAFTSSGITVSAIKKSGEDTEVIVFDADELGTPDPDLQVDNGLHLLILPEDGTLVDANNDDLIDEPNDSAAGGTIIFRAGLPRFVTSFDFVDHDNNAKAEARFYDSQFGGNLLKTVQIPNKGDGSVQTIHVNVGNVQRVEIEYHDSGGVTNIHFLCTPPPCVECEKPTIFTVKYEGPKDDVKVKIFKNVKNGKPADFVFNVPGTFDSGDEITIDSKDFNQQKVNSNTVYAFYKWDKLIGFIKIHTSCSQELFIDQMFFFEKGWPNKQIKLTVISGFDKDGKPSIPDASCPAPDKDDDDDDNGKHDDDDDNGKHDDDDDNGKHDDDDDNGKHDDDDDNGKHDDDDNGKHDDDDDNGKHDDSKNQCKGFDQIEMKYTGYYSPVKIVVSKDGKNYESYSTVRNTDMIKLTSKNGDYINDDFQFKIFRGKYLVDEIKVDATCSDLKDKGQYYKGSKGSKLMIQKYEKMGK